MHNCVHCKRLINSIEFNNCYSCDDGCNDCKIILCLSCGEIDTIYDSVFEYTRGYLDICKACYIIRLESS